MDAAGAAKAVALADAGFSQRRIGRLLGYPRTTIQESIRRYRNTASEARNRLFEVRNISVSLRTIRRRLAERDFRAYRPARVPELATVHRRARLEFAREHINWTSEQWKAVLFTDESRIALRHPDGRQRVYRRRGERFAEGCLVQTVGFEGGSIMVWAGIAYDARTELVVFDRGSVDAHSTTTLVHTPPEWSPNTWTTSIFDDYRGQLEVQI
ncbi:uncharacterized protein LOC123321711 [Coccinella septempunctata]|uniref:uncharacterized protein LOC123321711 n=1 Tax=Coccinella septempunctata TaxID=41139 RepID=UPI001D08659E|nr:uncharacterized protein LOC123321711 [Coccinella septempunctata]